MQESICGVEKLTHGVAGGSGTREAKLRWKYSDHNGRVEVTWAINGSIAVVVDNNEGDVLIKVEVCDGKKRGNVRNDIE